MRGMTLAKKAALLGGRREVQAHQPVHQVGLSFGPSSKIGFFKYHFSYF